MIAGIGIARGDGMLDPSAFPGRWNPRRSIPPDIEPLATAASLALEGAGWWRPRSGDVCPGALVVACDGASVLPATRFARELRDASGATVGPSGFLFALPSSAAAVLGLLFGFTEYQATVTGGAPAGARALRHALDLLELGRVRRALVAVLGASGDDRAAVAWCLEPGLRVLLEISCGVAPSGAEATILGPGPRFPAADLLLEASSRLGGPAGVDRVEVGGAWISLDRKGI